MNVDPILEIDAGRFGAVGVILIGLVVVWIVGGIVRRWIDHHERRPRRALTAEDDRIRQAVWTLPPPRGLPPCFGDHDLVDSDEGWVVCQTVGCGYGHRAQP